MNINLVLRISGLAIAALVMVVLNMFPILDLFYPFIAGMILLCLGFTGVFPEKDYP